MQAWQQPQYSSSASPQQHQPPQHSQMQVLKEYLSCKLIYQWPLVVLQSTHLACANGCHVFRHPNVSLPNAYGQFVGWKFRMLG